MFTDNFNRASLGSGWETVEGSAWVTASSLYLKPAGTYAHSGVRVVGSFPNDQYAEVYTEVPSGAGDASSHQGPAVRMGASGDCYYAYFTLTEVTIYKRVSGTSTFLNNGSYTALSANTLYKVKLVVTGNSLEAFVNDVSEVTTTDSAVASGNPACHILTGEASLFPRFDDFSSTDFTAGGGVSKSAHTMMGVG